MTTDKTKVYINHESADITPHDFEKQLIKDSRDIFLYNENGKIQGLDYLKYGQAATTLMAKLIKNRKAK